MDLGKAIRVGRLKRGMTQKALGEMFGVSKSAVAQWESGDNMPDPRKIPELVRLLALDPAVVVGDTFETNSDPQSTAQERSISASMRSPSAEGDVQFQGPAPPLRHEYMPRDIPVLGVSVGGAEGDFIMDINGEVVDHARRTPYLGKRRDVFALIVQGDSMSPWREIGQLVYVENRPAREKDYVVVELKPEHPGDPAPAYLKRLVRATGSKIILEQFKPARTFEIERRRIHRIFRVMDWSELLAS